MSKRFFLLGDWRCNAGPSNVNRSIVLNSDEDMGYIRSSNKIIMRIERLKWLFYPTILVSGSIPGFEIKIFKLFRKKIVYLMHGCLSYETKINRLNTPEFVLRNERHILSTADAIICVSKTYSEWVKKELEYAVSQKTVEFIEPIPLEQPDVCPPPESLMCKHFNDWTLRYLNNQ